MNTKDFYKKQKKAVFDKQYPDRVVVRLESGDMPTIWNWKQILRKTKLIWSRYIR